MRSSRTSWGAFPEIRLVCSIIGILISLGCSGSTGLDDEDTDQTPPIAVSDLSIISSTSQTVLLQWTTPEDRRDDSSGGMVDEYDLRMSFDTITVQNFAAVTAVNPVPEPLPAGQVQQWTIAGLTPDCTYYFTLKSGDDRGNWSSISNCVWVHCAAIEVVTIADSALERAIRNHIDKSTGDILTPDIDTIWQIVFQNTGIQSLGGLEHFTSLLYLDVAGNEIEDLSPLGDLKQLVNLLVSRNRIDDITPLTDMVTLRQLHLDDNPISDISPLATTDSLQRLILWGTQVTDFSPLYDLYFLSEVAFDRMDLTDIGFMSHLKRPQLCGLAFNQITSVEPLWNVYTLQTLNLMQNQITDISALSSLINIRELRLTNNQINDIMPLVHNTGLDSGDVLYIDGNPLSQYSSEVLIPTLEFRGVTVYHQKTQLEVQKPEPPTN